MQALSLSASLTFSPFPFLSLSLSSSVFHVFRFCLCPCTFVHLPWTPHTLSHSLLWYIMEMCFANGKVCLMSSVFSVDSPINPSAPSPKIIILNGNIHLPARIMTVIITVNVPSHGPKGNFTTSREHETGERVCA